MSASQRKNSLTQLRAIQSALGEVEKGGVVPAEIRRLTANLIKGGGMQERLQMLGVPSVPKPVLGAGFEAKGAALLLNALSTVAIDFLPAGCCGVPLPSAEGRFIHFCKGTCSMDEDEDKLVCENCDTPQEARYLRYAEGLYAVAIRDTEVEESEEAGKGESGMGESGMGKICVGVSLTEIEILVLFLAL